MPNFLDKMENDFQSQLQHISELAKKNERSKVVARMLEVEIAIKEKKELSEGDKAVIKFIDDFIDIEMGGLKCYMD